MLKHTLMLLPLLLSFSAQAEYDSQRIKQTLDKHQQTFQIQEWQTDPLSGEHTAHSQLKGLKIAINRRQAILSEPFVNARMYGPAKKRCIHFGEIGLNAYRDTELLAISETVAKATRRHAMNHTELNGVRFEVLPKQVGPFVQLVCRLKALP